MWDIIIERMPKIGVFLYTAVAFLVPYGIYKLNKKMHQFGDPPWKKGE